MLSLDLRGLGIPEVPMLGRYNFTTAQPSLPDHIHPGAMEICFLAKGTQIYRVGRRDYVMRGGDLFVTFPGEKHSSGETPQEKGVLYWIIVLLPRAGSSFLQCPIVASQELTRRLLAVPHRHFPGVPELQAMLDAIMAAGHSGRDPLRGIFVRAKLVEFLLKFLECSRQKDKGCVSKGINELLREVEVRAGEPFPVGEMAARVGLSVSRFKARFKQELGIPPAEYVQRSKLATAKALLSARKNTITDIAFQLGFSSSQYFATVFKRYTGQSPREFRNGERT